LEVSFVPFNELFLEASWKWLQDEELRYLIDSTPVSKEQQLQWYNSLSKKTDYKIWGVVYNELPIGVCGLKNITTTQGEYWGYIGEKTFWGKGIGKAILLFIEEFARGAHLNEMVLHVLATNERAIKLYKKNGYEVVNDQAGELMLMKKVLIHD